LPEWRSPLRYGSMRVAWSMPACIMACVAGCAANTAAIDATRRTSHAEVAQALPPAQAPTAAARAAGPPVDLFVRCDDPASCPEAVGMVVFEGDGELERCTGTLVGRDSPSRGPGRARAAQAPTQLVNPLRGRGTQQGLPVGRDPLAPRRWQRGRDLLVARRPLPLPARLHRLRAGRGRRRGRHVLRRGRGARLVRGDTGEVLSAHRIEPGRSYWRNQRRDPGRWPGSRATE
jgi:hypothetical protein